MQRARPRARRSRYNVSYRLTRSVPAVVGALLLVVVIVTATLTYKRIDDFVTATTGRHVNPIGEVVEAIEPASSRVSMISIPRDLVVRMNLQDNGRIWINKINAAYEVPYVNVICCVASQYQGRDGGGYAAEHEVSKITGIEFDRYIAVDFKAFRDMVDALGGVDVCLTTNLDDYSYPDYSGGYHPIH